MPRNAKAVLRLRREDLVTDVLGWLPKPARRRRLLLLEFIIARERDLFLLPLPVAGTLRAGEETGRWRVEGGGEAEEVAGTAGGEGGTTVSRGCAKVTFFTDSGEGRPPREEERAQLDEDREGADAVPG